MALNALLGLLRGFRLLLVICYGLWVVVKSLLGCCYGLLGSC